MPRDAFFDTNVLVFLGSAEPRRAERSHELLRDGGVVSIQVLNEYVSVTRGRLRLRWRHVMLGLDGIRAKCDVVPLTIETHARGIDLVRRHRLNVYDAMIVAAAVLGGCTTLYSEDMHDGLVIDGLTIRNPYAA